MSERLRVLLVGPLPPPTGGMAVLTRQLADLLSLEGLEIEVMQSNAPYRPKWVRSIRGVRGVIRMVPYVYGLWRRTAAVRVVHVMANSGWAWFFCAAPAIWVARLRDVPVVVNYHGGLAREFLKTSARYVVPTLKRSAVVIVPSRFLKEVFASYGVTAEIISNVVDPRLFHAGSTVRPFSDDPHIVIARNLESIYGIDIALEAIALLRAEFPRLRVSITGSGPQRASLEEMCHRLGLIDCVRFTGRLEQVSMGRLYQEAHVVLNPSRADNSPVSILEALACGVPVVSTRVGGVPYLVEHGRTAWLVAPESPSEMADGLAHVLRDRVLRESLRSAGLDLARACCWPAVKEQWLDAYRRAADWRPA